MTPPARAARLGCTLGTWLGAALLLGSGCATHADAIERGQRYYEDNQYERALALWRDLELRGARLAPAERARFAYFRGMTDYRLGFRDEARHWLAVARAVELGTRGVLQPAWLERLDDALADLDRASAAGARPARADVVQTIEAPPEALAPGTSAAPPGGNAPGTSAQPPDGNAPGTSAQPPDGNAPGTSAQPPDAESPPLPRRR